MFKEKNTKKRIVVPEFAKDNSTLDAKHNNMIYTMTQKQQRLQELRLQHDKITEQVNQLNQSIQEIKKSGTTDSEEYNSAWTNTINLKDQLVLIDKEIVTCMSSQEEIDYYENTGYILFQYYDLIDKQTEQNQQVLPCTRVAPTKYPKSRKKLPPPPSITILDALHCHDAKPDSSQVSQPSLSQPSLSQSSHSLHSSELNQAEELGNEPPLRKSASSAMMTMNDGTTQPMDKTHIVDEYLALVDSSYVRSSPTDALGNCPRCGISLECIQYDGAMVCVDCGYQELLLVEQNRPILRHPSKDASHFSYKRINHFREWCSQVQGKESTDIPDEIFEQILQEIRKEKIHDTKKLTYSKMREILKKLKINRYYEHINYIINRINGVPTPHFSPELEDKLCTMFKEIQGPFLRHCPAIRKNFLSYAYVLFKFFQLLGMDEYLRYFSLLKSREKLYLQDQIWKLICKDLGWPAYASL